MEENKMTEQESLAIITEMIGKAKSSYISTGVASMVWGVLIIFCSLITWVQIFTNHFLNFDIWLLVFLAVIPQIFYSIKERKNKKFVSHDENVMTYTWSTFGICIFILSFYNGKFGSVDDSATSLFMLLYGIPTFITGGVFKFKPMILGGLLCWVFSVISMFTKIEIDMLLMASCGLFAWLIPGIILWQKYKKQPAKNV